MDLTYLHLRTLIEGDAPFGEVASVLKEWRGPLPEKLVHALGEYFRADRPRIVGRPKKGTPTATVDALVMGFYFLNCEEGLTDPLRTTCDSFGWNGYTDKKTNSYRCTKFEETRARFNKMRRKGAVVLYRHLEKHFDASREDIIEAVRLRESPMPKEYFDQYILPNL